MEHTALNFSKLLERHGEQIDIAVVDVGAFPQSGAHPVYQALLDHYICSVIGFEPLPGACDKLNQEMGARHKFFPFVVGDGRVREFKVCNVATLSSLYEPNTELINKFDLLGQFSKVIQRQTVQTVRLDDISEIDSCDYMKVDVQGGELEVLLGAQNLLNEVCVLESEVEFIQYYQDQPLFADIDREARKNGSMFHKFKAVSSYPLLPFKSKVNSQTIWADAIFVRNISALELIPPDKLLKTGVILHEIYGSYDLASLFLREYDSKTGNNICTDYLSFFQDCMIRDRVVYIGDKVAE